MDKDKLFGYEMIQVGSGHHYKLLTSDISYYTLKAKEILSKYIKEKDKIAFFLSLDQMNFSQLIIYNACIECGATVMRCTISEMERQIPINHDISVDYIIIGSKSLKYIREKVQFDKCIFFETMHSFQCIDEGLEQVVTIYDLFDIPGFLIVDDKKNVYCPGYVIKQFDLNRLTISTCKEVDSFFIKDMEIDINDDVCIPGRKDSNMLRTRDFINTQLRFLLGNKFNMRSDENDLILDSLGMIELLVFMEDEFEIVIPIDSVNKTDFKKLDQLSFLVSNLLLEG